MFCVIQEIELKKPNKYGRQKELLSNYMQMTINGQDVSHYYYAYSEERFDRPIKKAYKISIHQSYRENGKPKKRQYSLCTVSYYDLIDRFFGLYDYEKKIIAIAEMLEVDANTIHELVETKMEPIIAEIEAEFSQTEEFRVHEEHKSIITVYSAKKCKFAETYNCDSSKYDEIYDVFGNLMNEEKLKEIEADYKFRQEYEKTSHSYQEQYQSNYKNEYNSSYSDNIHSNHSTEDKGTLKQFYRELSKKFHPDANPDVDTSEQMKLLNQLKNEWGV